MNFRHNQEAAQTLRNLADSLERECLNVSCHIETESHARAPSRITVVLTLGISTPLNLVK